MSEAVEAIKVLLDEERYMIENATQDELLLAHNLRIWRLRHRLAELAGVYLDSLPGCQESDPYWDKENA